MSKLPSQFKDSDGVTAVVQRQIQYDIVVVLTGNLTITETDVNSVTVSGTVFRR